jgi:CubicO group peptidase (beta-lactamase class C family)
MTPGNRRLVVRAVVVIALLAGAAGVWAAVPILRIGVGHKAKTLCSGVFVAGRDPAAVLADLEVDDLAVLRYVDAHVDYTERTVTADALGIMTRRAVYRPGLGCALALGGLNPPAAGGSANAASANGSSGELPIEAAGAPSSDGPDRGRLDAAVTNAFAEPDLQYPRRTKAVVVMHRGRIVAERYADGIGPATPLQGWSMTKSVMNALVGILVGERRLGLRAPVPIPEWQQPGDPRRSITLEHLLHMSSGLRFDEGMSGPRSDVMRMLFEFGDASLFTIGKDLAFAPGSHWQYSSGTTNVLARVMRNVLSSEAEYLSFPRNQLFARIGMTTAVVETDTGGTFIGSSYMYASARDWARFGWLYAQDGLWNGARVLPAGWVQYSSSPAPADATKRYGAHFWCQIPEPYAGKDARVPVAAIHAAGHEGQFLTIVPSRELVIVRLGRTRHAVAWDQAAFVRDVLAALEP